MQVHFYMQLDLIKALFTKCLKFSVLYKNVLSLKIFTKYVKFKDFWFVKFTIFQEKHNSSVLKCFNLAVSISLGTYGQFRKGQHSSNYYLESHSVSSNSWGNFDVLFFRSRAVHLLALASEAWYFQRKSISSSNGSYVRWTPVSILNATQWGSLNTFSFPNSS